MIDLLVGMNKGYGRTFGSCRRSSPKYQSLQFRKLMRKPNYFEGSHEAQKGMVRNVYQDSVIYDLDDLNCVGNIRVSQSGARQHQRQYQEGEEGWVILVVEVVTSSGTGRVRPANENLRRVQSQPRTSTTRIVRNNFRAKASSSSRSGIYSSFAYTPQMAMIPRHP
ncbi:hypothetical protein HZH68_003861 [Vespula germanica]|uniref:Uncharacterized protein n=1 Tax=Vespula germanica TaxID=30212 RepID=A0A834KMN8_VESGE|nr:hypothetical protein HZH68_003861 [Vespula germanica]